MSAVTGLVCSYPGCTTGGSVERCANLEGRLACAAHRTMRGGHYICLRCDEEATERKAVQQIAQAAEAQATAAVAIEAAAAAAAAESARIAASRHGWLLIANGLTFAIGAFLVVNLVVQLAGSGSTLPLPLVPAFPEIGPGYVSLGVTPIDLIFFFCLAGPAWSYLNSGGFRRGRLAARSSLRRALYWVTALPGLAIGGPLAIGLIVAGVVLILILLALPAMLGAAAKQEAHAAAVEEGVSRALDKHGL